MATNITANMVAIKIAISKSSETGTLENWEKIKMNCMQYLKNGLKNSDLRLNALKNFLSVKL